MNKLIARRSQIQPLNHTYLLNPINILSTVRIPFGQTQHSNHSPSSPLLTAHIEITSLNLKFHSHQALQASNLLNTMKFHQKIQRLSVGQLLQLSNKMRVDTTATAARGHQEAVAAVSAGTLKNLEESVQTGESQADHDVQNAEQTRAHELPNEQIDMSIFDLGNE